MGGVSETTGITEELQGRARDAQGSRRRDGAPGHRRVRRADERRLAERAAESEQALKHKPAHQKEMVLGAMGIPFPLLAIAAVFTGLPGVLVICAAPAVMAVASAR